MHIWGENWADFASHAILCNLTEMCEQQPPLLSTSDGVELHPWNNCMHKSSVDCLRFIALFSSQCVCQVNEYKGYKSNSNVGLFFSNTNGLQC